MQLHPHRAYVLMLFRNGQLSSLGEGLVVAGVSKPTLQRWLLEARIDWRASRLQQLARHHVKAERHASGLPPGRRPSKAEMRRTTGEAVRRFNAANASKS